MFIEKVQGDERLGPDPKEESKAMHEENEAKAKVLRADAEKQEKAAEAKRQRDLKAEKAAIAADKAAADPDQPEPSPVFNVVEYDQHVRTKRQVVATHDNEPDAEDEADYLNQHADPLASIEFGVEKVD